MLRYSPDPRMVITLERLHISKSLNKTIRSDKFEVKVDTNFECVIHHCKAIQRKNQNGTWINNDMVHVYTALHLQGFAHLVEVYKDSQLVGGLYRVALGQVFLVSLCFH
ncbi:leucyl/phenylalanyl-tRNA--protein transferase [Candidatus Ruthia endofausta]|uniref:leucyl/phenylalanyl-tRNA--protein transferase n=1 Tax=Candidatus Ruthia endofausta TaxID=2738852 RepID=UPI001FE2A6B9|nr:leucyl/phenylalanyl-tRNA--protein transferase [Candidatus Ruthia endofausta]